jgi:LPXTG-motif cell wall-anchored protein
MHAGTLAVVLAGAFLTGCQSSVVTEIVPVEGGADVRVVVEFEGDVADVLKEDERSRNALESQLETLVDKIEIVESGERYILRPTAAEMTESSALTGVGAVRVGRVGVGIEVQVDTVEPVQLRQAIRDTTAGAEDAEALETTMLANTFLEVRIVFPGTVREHNGGVLDDNIVRYRDPINKWSPGTLVVRGEDSARDWLPWVGLAVLLLLAGGWYVRRRT